MQQKTIFTDIVNGSAPSYKLYEDEDTLAFLDIKPVTTGHALVITKLPIDHLDEADPDLYVAVFRTVHTVSKMLKKKLKPERIAVVVHGYEIPHAHVHIVPLYNSHDLTLADRSKAKIDHPSLRQLHTKLGGVES